MTARCLFRISFCLGLLFAAAAGGGRAFRPASPKRDITPEIGMETPGRVRQGVSPVAPRSVQGAGGRVRRGFGPVAIVGIDALFIRRPTVLAIRRQIQDKCGIAPGGGDDCRVAFPRGRSDGLLSAG